MLRAKGARRGYKARIVRAFLSTYIIIALIPIVVGFAFYTYTYRVVYENEYEKTREMLSQSVSSMDSNFQSIREIMSRIMQSSALRPLLTGAPPSEEADTVIDAIYFQRELKQLYFEDSLIYDVLVYLKAPNMLFGARNGYSLDRPEVFYPAFLELEDFTEEQWNEILQSAKSSFFVPARSAVVESYSGGKDEERTLGLFVWPLYKDGVARGSVIFLLDGERFARYMETVADGGTGALAWVETSDGQIIMRCPAEAQVNPANEAGMLSVSERSMYNQLVYNVRIPDTFVDAKVSWLRWVIVGTVAASVLLGLGAATVFARRLGAPLDRISDNLSKLYALEQDDGVSAHTVRRNPMEQLGDSVNELIEKHGQLSRYVSRQINVVDQMFFEKLLGGYFGDEEQIYAMLEYVSQPRLEGPFLLALVVMERANGEVTVSDMSELGDVRAEAFQAELTAPWNMFETNLGSCALIFSLSNISHQEVERQLSTALARIRGGLGLYPDVRVKAAISLPVERYIQLSRAYARCAELIHSCATEAELICQRDGAPQVYSYSLDVENQLINFTVVGNREKVHELIAGAFGEYHAQDYPSPSQRLLAQGMCATLMRVHQLLGWKVDDWGIQDTARQLVSADSLSTVRDTILGCFDAIIDQVQSRQHGRTQALMEAVQRYLEANFGDSELTLTSAAAHFSLADAYLSRAFKDFKGINFSAYLEKLRIDHALTLIDGSLSLDEIAVQSGFEHLYNMRSAFKRVLGVTPSEYRKRVKRGG